MPVYRACFQAALSLEAEWENVRIDLADELEAQATDSSSESCYVVPYDSSVRARVSAYQPSDEEGRGRLLACFNDAWTFLTKEDRDGEFTSKVINVG